MSSTGIKVAASRFCERTFRVIERLLGIDSPVVAVPRSLKRGALAIFGDVVLGFWVD